MYRVTAMPSTFSRWDPFLSPRPYDDDHPRRKLNEPPGSDVVSVWQIVAYNMARARTARGMTQDALGSRLEQLTGKKWSRATVSAAESGWDGTTGRVRHFDVSELAALAIALR